MGAKMPLPFPTGARALPQSTGETGNGLHMPLEHEGAVRTRTGRARSDGIWGPCLYLDCRLRCPCSHLTCVEKMAKPFFREVFASLCALAVLARALRERDFSDVHAAGKIFDFFRACGRELYEVFTTLCAVCAVMYKAIIALNGLGRKQNNYVFFISKKFTNVAWVLHCAGRVFVVQS